MTMKKEDIKPTSSPRPIIFLDIDGVLNCTKHNKQIHFEATHLKRLKTIIEKTNAIIVLSTFWRHFHEYITYVFHRHGIDVASCMLPLPMGATRGKQTTKTFLHFHRLKQEEGGDTSGEKSMIGRSADDDAEYSSRAEEIEAWLQTYGEQYLGGGGETIEGEEDTPTGYDWHNDDWKYIILDDRPSAAKPDTPLYDRFVHTRTEVGVTDDEVDWAIELLRCGPKDTSTHRIPTLDVESLEKIFSHEQLNISSDLAVLLTPENSPTKSKPNSLPKQQEKNQLKQESPSSTNAEDDVDEILNSSSHEEYESEVLAAMCDYSNVCPTLVALMQPPMKDDDGYYLSPTKMKSFEEEKKTSFDEVENKDVDDDDDDTKETDCNSQPDQEVGSSLFDSLTDNKKQNEPPIPPRSSPPMSVFHKFSPTFYEHNDDEDNNDILGLDDLGQRWKKNMSSLSDAVGAPPLTTKDGSDKE